jgi:hypothetical protein
VVGQLIGVRCGKYFLTPFDERLLSGCELLVQRKQEL